MAEHRDRTELREDIPEEVRHPNRQGAPGPALVVGMAVAAIMLILIAVAVTVV